MEAYRRRKWWSLNYFPNHTGLYLLPKMKMLENNSHNEWEVTTVACVKGRTSRNSLVEGDAAEFPAASAAVVTVVEAS